eukprot:Gb_15597 [translate_table: standard]
MALLPSSYIVSFFFLVLHQLSQSAGTTNCFPTTLFSFGDSKADTGNLQVILPLATPAQLPPYGRTYFHRPADRFCDGRLVIDFQAQAYNLALLNPNLRGGSSFADGANFSVSGAGAVNNAVSVALSLSQQVDNFSNFKRAYVRGVTSPLEAKVYFGGGLYVVSIGENDYRKALRNGTSPQQVKLLVPAVVRTITNNLERLYGEGARKLLVVGIAADGCLPLLLTTVKAEPTDYDSLGCLKPVNEYVQLHNKQLLDAVKLLRNKYPDALFPFADYYGINIEILSNPSRYGFEYTLKTCCGVGGGKYNFNESIPCGRSGVLNGGPVTATSCPDPSKYVVWDGTHLTDNFYKEVAKAFLTGPYIDQPLPLSRDCCLNFTLF